MFVETNEPFAVARVQSEIAERSRMDGVRALMRKERRLQAEKKCRVEFRAFEVSVFNSDVLAALKNNEDHPYYSERWCTAQRSIILARDEIELADKIQMQFPCDCGFVIENVIERRKPHVL